MSRRFTSPAEVMQHALQIARAGRGYVEPNPQVGAVIVDDQLQWISEGYHQKYGGPHAEIRALQAAGERARGAHMFVTLEPCNHYGKTPPCSDALVAAGIRKVFIGCLDPAPHTHHQGVDRLRQAGLDVETGLLQEQAEILLRPFTKLITTQTPYVHAKWAMTLDGKIATRTGSSKWISNASSRQLVHEQRGMMDAILVGRGTVAADDPLLTARPAGPRTPARIVLDSQATLSRESQLVQTAREIPVILACLKSASTDRRQALQDCGVEILPCPPDDQGQPDLHHLLQQLGQRRMTNLLIEGGAQVLGRCFDQQLIDEAHVFIAPKIVGGAEAASPVEGLGLAEMTEALQLTHLKFQSLEDDIYINGLIPFHRSGNPAP